MHPKDETHVAKPYDKYLYAMNHLTGLKHVIKINLYNHHLKAEIKIVDSPVCTLHCLLLNTWNWKT